MADDYPSKPVRIVVPFAPGGINDVAARVVGTHLTESLGKQFIVENKPGAGGVVANELVANSPPDGYTIIVISIANAAQPALYKLPYDPHKAFDSGGDVRHQPERARGASVAAGQKRSRSSSRSPSRSRATSNMRPAASRGSLHLAMELFKIVTKTDLLHVPFRGAGPAGIDVVAGNTKAIIATASSLSGHIRNGKLRGLGVASKQRLPALPDVPTFIEAGLPEYEGGNWIGFAVPAGTPKAVIEKLHKEIAAIQDMPEVQKQMEARGAAVEKMGIAEFRKYMESETAKWTHVIKTAGITAQ